MPSVDIPRTLPEVLRRAIEAALSDCHVAVPGRVATWNPVLNLADVEVMVQHSVWDDDNGRTYEDVGVLPGVPVVWPRAGGMLLTFPMVAGDTGLLVFNSDAIGEWRSTNQKSQPTDATRMSTGWPVFIPGLVADVKPFTQTDPHSTMGIIGIDGAPQQIRFNPISGTVDVGVGALGVGPTNFAAYGDVNDVNWTAAKTLETAVGVLAAALGTYATAIQPVANPPGTATTTLVAAITTFQGALTAYSAAILPTKASVARVK